MGCSGQRERERGRGGAAWHWVTDQLRSLELVTAQALLWASGMSEIKWGKLWSTAPAVRCSGQWAMGQPAGQVGLSPHQLPTHTHTLTVTLTHSHAHTTHTVYTHTCTHTQSYSTQSHNVLPLVHILAHTHSCSHTLTLSHIHSYTVTHTNTHSQSHTHTHIHTAVVCGGNLISYLVLLSTLGSWSVVTLYTGGDAEVQKQ